MLSTGRSCHAPPPRQQILDRGPALVLRWQCEQRKKKLTPTLPSLFLTRGDGCHRRSQGRWRPPRSHP